MLFDIIFWLGIALTILAIALLGFMILKAYNALKLPKDEQQMRLQRLISLNFGALALAIMGLMMVFLSLRIS